MAVSNAIGSNVFDICLGIGIPYFVKTAFVDSGSTISVGADSDVVSPIIILGITLIVVVGCLLVTKWRLTRGLGFVYLAGYAAFVIWSVLNEAFGIIS